MHLSVIRLLSNGFHWTITCAIAYSRLSWVFSREAERPTLSGGRRNYHQLVSVPITSAPSLFRPSAAASDCVKTQFSRNAP